MGNSAEHRQSVLAIMRVMVDMAGQRHQPVMQRILLMQAMTTLCGPATGWIQLGQYHSGEILPRLVNIHCLPQTSPALDQRLRRHLAHQISTGQSSIDTNPLWPDRPTLAAAPQQILMDPHPQGRKMTPSAAEQTLTAWALLGPPYADAVLGVTLLGSAIQAWPMKLILYEWRHLISHHRFSFPELDAPASTHFQRWSTLPPRQAALFHQMMIGRHPKGMAKDLKLSIYTVREYQQNIYKHFDVQDRDELMALFIRPESLARIPGHEHDDLPIVHTPSVLSDDFPNPDSGPAS